MATCYDCGKKIGFLNTSNVVEGNLICGECDGKRSAKIAEEKSKDFPNCPNCNTKMIEEDIENTPSLLSLLFMGMSAITWSPGYRCPQCGNVFRKTQDSTNEATMEFNKDELKKAYKISAVIGILGIAVNFVLAVCVEILIKTSPQPVLDFVSKKEVNIALTTLVIISIGTYFFIPFVRKQILSNKPKTGNQSPLSFSQRVVKLMDIAVVSYALCDLFCIYGFLMFLLTWNNTYYYTFMVMSLISFGIFFQRRNQWEEWMKKMDVNDMIFNQT